ncbi:alpha/beta fold hydrolase [Phreatobacter sp.]|uniref:alpha/beta hydrolase n=1 Tax=Phreatobacter sp. TaxID=1966341 RepID=UPI003F6FE479
MTVYQRPAGATAPAVVIAHGFAGSRQLMEAYSLTLARAGYVVMAFDFEGHGRNPTPMSGDVTRIDGTTRLLMRETGRVIDAALAWPGVDGRVALLGHSMASDIIVRQAIADRRVSATVAISMFSEAVTATDPPNLLIVSGEWEATLRQNALRNVRLAEPSAVEGATVGDPSAGTGRRAAVGPGVEHVGVLYSTTALQEARTWLDAAFGRVSSGPVSASGGPIVLLLLGIVVLGWPLSRLLPRGEIEPSRLSLRTFLIVVALPATVTPVLLRFVDTRFLPVLVADYLAVHLFVYGVLSLVLLAWCRIRIGPIAWIPALALAAWGIVVFGGALDRYVASFWPIAARLPIVAAIAVGALPCMLADSLVTEGGRAALWRRFAARAAFIASLGAAVALDFQRLFFLLIIIPVIVLFFTIFGLMGGWVGRRTGSPAAAGVALGLTLAWAIGVSFPMFAPG